ncbi:MAG: Wzz/FepE/Etk N-terminal domain-containing protein [candidate division Zixibacteria bacterium]|nr:Wzz/FepE/Etk N-terminal domain-containing protein [candidate division Zixibacteria bacterium]MDD5427060.1 Wzz/FepE/Etk N-terminal domain-containing protein [candidate division Zixibacteria bacterium]
MNEIPSSNLWLFFEGLARRRGFIFLFVILVTLAAVVVSLLLPKWYEANALLLPPKDISMPVGSYSKLAEVVSITEGLNLPVMVTPTDVHARMLSSRTLVERVIEKFDLKNYYGTTNMIETHLVFMSHARIEVTPEGLLSVSFEDRDPQMAADITNALVAELNLLNQEIVTSRAKQSKTFIEQRLAEVAHELDSLREVFEQFQIDNKAIDFDQQTRLAIEQAVQLKVSLTNIEIDLQMSELMLGKDNPDLVEKRKRRDIIKSRLEQLETLNPDSSFFSLPIALIPRLKGEYQNLYRRVRVNESLYTILLEQLEQAKIHEREEAPTITVLDHARVPEVRSRPRRTLLVAGSFGFSVLAAVMLAFIFEYFRQLSEKKPGDYKRVAMFIAAYLGWLPGVRRLMNKQ